MFVNNVMEVKFPDNLYQAVVGKTAMPVDGSGTLFYVLEFLSPKNRQLLLQRFKEGLSFRKIGEMNGISGARAERVISDTIDQLKQHADMLKNGIMVTMRNLATQFAEEVTARIESECREKYTKEGYQMGYVDGIMKREKAFYSYGKYDEITIDDLDLSNRSYNALQRNGIYSVSDLIHAGNGIVDIENLGKKSIEEIIEKLAEIGVPVGKYFKRIMLEYDIA